MEAEAVEAEEVEAEEVEVEVVEVEAVEDHQPCNSHNNHSNNKMLHQRQMSKQWESFPTCSMVIEQRPKTLSKKSKDTSILTKT